jgi:prepilin-type N-terminal cleavage/methylation domain-containing protein
MDSGINLLLSILRYTCAMRFIPRFISMYPPKRAFSLVELSVVVAIISVVAALGLEAAANFVNRTATSVSRDRLKMVDEAVANFFKVYGRLPCPAILNENPTATTYGQENCAASATAFPAGTGAGGGSNVLTGTTIGGGLMAGGVPFRNLNLPMMYAVDGFNSKFSYVVTRNLTVAGGTVAANPVVSRFGSFDTDNTCTDAGTCAAALTASSGFGMGGIEVRTGILAQPCSGNCQKVADPTYDVSNRTPTGAAYIIISHGADQRGARSDRGAQLRTCTIYANERRVDTQNCVFGASLPHAGISATGGANNIPNNVFYDNRYNAGLNLTSYFDDVVIWRPKAKL